MNFHFVGAVVPIYLKQHEQRHACRALKRKALKPLYVVLDGLSSFLNYREELGHDYLSAILIELGEKLSFQVKPGIDRAGRKASKPVKGYPLEGANEHPSHNDIIIYYITDLRAEVIIVLIW